MREAELPDVRATRRLHRWHPLPDMLCLVTRPGALGPWPGGVRGALSAARGGGKRVTKTTA